MDDGAEGLTGCSRAIEEKTNRGATTIVAGICVASKPLLAHGFVFLLNLIACTNNLISQSFINIGSGGRSKLRFFGIRTFDPGTPILVVKGQQLSMLLDEIRDELLFSLDLIPRKTVQDRLFKPGSNFFVRSAAL